MKTICIIKMFNRLHYDKISPINCAFDRKVCHDISLNQGAFSLNHDLLTAYQSIIAKWLLVLYFKVTTGLTDFVHFQGLGSMKTDENLLGIYLSKIIIIDMTYTFNPKL